MTETNTPNPTNDNNGSAVKAVGSFVWDLVKILVIALVIIIPFRMFVAEPFVVSGTSMVPNFQNNDYLIIDRLSYRLDQTRGPRRGDVIVFHFPLDTSQYFIKRVIGLPGETVSFNNGRVYVTNKEHPQGWELDEPYLPHQGETFSANSKPVTLGEGEYFVLGDNRTGSSDSRVWGILPQQDIVGRAWLRVVPVNSFGVIPRHQYN